MKKGMESLAFIAVAVLVVFSLRVALGTCERSEHEYKYAGSLNLEEETKEIAEETEETEEEEQNEETEVEDEPSDDDTPPDTDDHSSTGNSNGGGGGDGTGNKPGKTTVSAAPSPTPSPAPSPTPAPEPEATAEPTDAPEDKIKSIKCSWPDKDALVYGKSIPRDTMVVTAVYESGKEEKLSEKDYQVSGLRTTICGKHKLTISYGEFECKLTYTVANYIVQLTYAWDFPNKCYKGEVIDDYVLQVYAQMADGSEEEIPFGDYDLSGIDSDLTDKDQKFTIRYKGFEVSGICRFYKWTVTVHNVYCSDEECHDVVHEVVGKPQEVSHHQRIKSLETGTEKSYEGNTYVLKKEEITAYGNKKKLPYTVDSREFDIQIYRYFVLDSDSE